jgi:hypothetical protein
MCVYPYPVRLQAFHARSCTGLILIGAINAPSLDSARAAFIAWRSASSQLNPGLRLSRMKTRVS